MTISPVVVIILAAEAEKLIAPEKIPDAETTPKPKPIVSTEVVAEPLPTKALPTKVDLTNLELPSEFL